MKVTPIRKPNVINCCPHAINVYEGAVFNPATGKYKGGEEILHIPASGFLASAKSSFEDRPPVEINGVSIPTVSRNFTHVNELPDNGNIYIVSSVFAQACKDLGKNVSHLYTPCGDVVDETGRTIGCAKLTRYA